MWIKEPVVKMKELSNQPFHFVHAKMSHAKMHLHLK